VGQKIWASVYGETVIVAVLLVTVPMVAVIVTVPPCPVERPAAIVTVPADTVARLLLLVFQVATWLTLVEVPPPQGAAIAVIGKVGLLFVTVPLVGVSVIDVTHSLTVTVCVPVIVGFCVEVAVTLAVPVTVPALTKPPAEIVAAFVGVALILQVTDGFPVLPSL